MLCHARLGERAQALRLYQRFAERLRAELERSRTRRRPSGTSACSAAGVRRRRTARGTLRAAARYQAPCPSLEGEMRWDRQQLMFASAAAVLALVGARP